MVKNFFSLEKTAVYRPVNDDFMRELTVRRGIYRKRVYVTADHRRRALA